MVKNKLDNWGKLSQKEESFFIVLIRLKIEDAFLLKTVWGSYLVWYREQFKRLSFFDFGGALRSVYVCVYRCVCA